MSSTIFVLEIVPSPSMSGQASEIMLHPSVVSSNTETDICASNWSGSTFKIKSEKVRRFNVSLLGFNNPGFKTVFATGPSFW